MFESNLVDLDELVLMVRDSNSRAYIGEAITTYRVRAYRSALLATWIAVAYDIISKIRELELQGDAAAGAFVAVLENVIEANERGDPAAVQRLQAIENELLDKALKDFEFLSAQEHKDLDRLKNDRNLCAHPAFTKDTTLFQPSAELVRAHISHAVYHLLRHPPVQGRHALKRLKNDLLQPSFPSTQHMVSDFLESRYLNYAKVAFVESLVPVFLKVLIKQSEAALIGKEDRVLMCLVAVGLRHQAIYERKMAEQLPHLTDGSDDTELKRVFRLFKADKRCWGWLSNANRLRIIQIATEYTYDAADIDYVLEGVEIDELKPLLLARVANFSRPVKEQVFSRHHRPEFVGEAIELFASARSYRGAEAVEHAILLPLCSMFRPENVERILLAAEANCQIHDASGTPAFMEEMFNRTADLHAQTRHAWQQFMTKVSEGKDPDKWYAYPQLRARMEAVGMWPPPATQAPAPATGPPVR
jgi:hypothetical protein